MEEDPSEILGSAAANLFRRASSVTPPPLGADTSSAEPSVLQLIVQEVNKVLQTSFSLVEFDSRKGRALLQILSDVLATLSPSMKADLTAEDPQATGPRLAEFLCGILNYKPVESQPQFIDALCTGDEAVVYPILHWVLSHMPENEKRVYLAKYLIPVTVPEDMIASDEEVREMFQHYRSCVEAFKEAHKGVDRLRSQSNAEAAQKAMADLQLEQESLQQKVEALRKKLEALTRTAQVPQEALLAACQALRRQRVEESALQDRMSEQLTLCKMADHRAVQAQQRVAETQKFFGDMNVDRLCQALKEELTLTTVMLTDKVPKQIQEYRERVDAMHKVVSSAGDLEGLNRAVYQLEKDIQEIEDKARPKLSPSEQQSLGLFRQQASLVSSRKEKILQELQALQNSRRALEDQLALKGGELNSRQGSKILRGEEFRQYANSLRTKSTHYKKLKAELMELRSELGVVERTADVLALKSDTLNQSLASMETAKGIRGFRDMKDNLVSISENKAEVDEAKNKTLEELTQVVSEFVTNIRNKRNRLAPLILELRTTRQNATMQDGELQQKKELYDALCAELNSANARLQAEVDELREEWAQSESVYHRLGCQLTLLSAHSKRAAEEADFRGGGGRRLSDRHKTYTELLDDQISHNEAQTRELRERRKALEDTYPEGVQQMRWFRDLQTLLEGKLSSCRRLHSGHPGASSGLAGVEVGVDRLVL